MLAAVLEKHTSLSFDSREIYINVVGGLRLTEPAIDLAVVAALISSERQVALPLRSCFFGEVGLTGEVRGASLAGERVKEAVKLGFKHIYLPRSNEKYLADLKVSGVEFHFVREVSELEARFGKVRAPAPSEMEL
jgi:DNA repair protein RadA/Sms